MHRLRSKESGFGMIGIAIVVAAVLLAGVVGIRIYQAMTSKPSASTSQNTQINNSSIDAATYLDVKELGVKLKLQDQVKDATYVVQTLDDGSLAARFSTKSLEVLDSACDAKSGALGALLKSKADIDRLGNKLTPDGRSVFKFGDDYFTYMTPQALCSEKVQNSTGTLIGNFRESLKTLQLDK